MSLILKKRIITKTTKDVYVYKPFNPLLYDAANLLALYDGDVGLNNVIWQDQSTNGFDLTLFNAPTIINNAINGHDAIQFDGIDEYGLNANPAFVHNQPCTFYIVMKNVTYVLGSSFVDDGLVPDSQLLYNQPASPNIKMYMGGITLDTNPDIPVNTYDILTAVYNSPNNVLRTNNNAAVTGGTGANNGTGLTIGVRQGPSGTYSNTEFAYLILRQGADNTATQNLFINYLKNRFAL